MDNKSIRIPVEVFRSPLIGIAACFCALAAALGIPGTVMMFDREYRTYLMEDMMAGGITSAQVLQNYTLIHGAFLGICVLCSAVLFICLLMVLSGKAAKGLSSISTGAQWLLWGVNGGGIVLAVLYVYRFVRYVVLCFSVRDGLYPLYAMVISEALTGALAGFAFVQLRRFLNCVCDSGASMAYTLSTGKLDSYSIPGFTAVGFFLLGLLCLTLAADQFVTVTAAYDYIRGYYKLLVSENPVQLCTAACFFCCAVADMLLFAYLKRYKRICERALYENRKKILGR